MKQRGWWSILLCLFLCGSVLAGCQTDGGSGPKDAKAGPEATEPTHDYDQGKGDPRRARIRVDNTGSRVSVSVRTPENRWARTLDVRVNGRRTLLRRPVGKPANGPAMCRPQVSEGPDSLITRLTYGRDCLPKGKPVTATVSVDGEPPLKARATHRRKPNVLVIMTDDMRTDELQYMPNVQKLIGDEGVTFTNGFASLPLCCPARASVFTGQFPHNHGVWSQKPPFAFASMHDRETFPVWMHRAGYRNSYIGKYLNRFGRDPAPGRTTGNSLQYVPPGWDNFRPTLDGLTPKTKYWGGTHQYFNTTLGDNGHGFISNRGTYQTIAYTRLEKQNLRQDLKQKKPFFHFVSFSAPHVGGPHEDDDPKDLGTPGRPGPVRGIFDDIITEAPGAAWDDPDRSDKPNSMRATLTDDDREQTLESARQRAESLYLVDRSVGRLISTLKRQKQLANTTVVFTSDNGYFLGEQGKAQGKTLPYEPSLRVPVLMRGPGIPHGEIRTDPFLSVDFAPTFADIADGRLGHKVDGKSMLDVMRLGDETADDSWSRRVPTETVPTKSVIQKVSRRDPIGARTKQQLRGRVIGLRTHRYLYTEWAREPWDWEPGVDRELYDVLKDPQQYDNLAVDPKHKKQVAQFHKLVGRSHTCAGASCRVPLPENLR